MTSLLHNRKYMSRFCAKRDNLFNCRKFYGCNVSCPFWHILEIDRLITLKNLPFGEAFRLSIRKGIPRRNAKKIFEEVFGADFELIQNVMMKEN